MSLFQIVIPLLIGLLGFILGMQTGVRMCKKMLKARLMQAVDHSEISQDESEAMKNLVLPR